MRETTARRRAAAAAQQHLERLSLLAGGRLPATVTDWIALAADDGAEARPLPSASTRFTGRLVDDVIYYNADLPDHALIQVLAHEVIERRSRMENPDLLSPLDSEFAGTWTGDWHHLVAEDGHRQVAERLGLNHVSSSMDWLDWAHIMAPIDKFKYSVPRVEIEPAEEDNDTCI